VEPPAATVCDEGLAESENPNAGLTVSETVVVVVTPPPVPVTVIVLLPAAVLAVVPMVRVLVAPVAVGVTDEGLKLHVAPVGQPDADSVTAWPVPPVSVAVIVLVPELPATTLTEAGFAARLKLKAVLNVAVTDWAAVIVTEQVPVPLHPPPLQPAKVEPAPAVAVSVTGVPLA
jgi:hypothetical protein